MKKVVKAVVVFSTTKKDLIGVIMIKRLLLSAATGIGIWLLFLAVIFGLTGLGFKFNKPGIGSFTNGEIMVGIVTIIGIISVGIVFMKTETKNTMMEDIVVNQMKIIAAKQKEKLNSLNK